MSFRVLFPVFVMTVVTFGSGCESKRVVVTEPKSSSDPVGGAPIPNPSTTDGAKPGVVKRELPDNSADQTEGVAVALGRLTSWGGFQNRQQVGGPVINLSLRGPKLAEAKAIRTIIAEAIADSGTELPRHGGFGAGNDDDGLFRELRTAFGRPFGEDEAQECEQKLSYYAPRGMASINRLAGSVELLIPSPDSADVITASFSADAGKPLKNEALQAAGVEMMLGTPMSDNTLFYQIKDPQNAVGSVELVNSDGEKLDGIQGSSSSGTKQTSMTVSTRFATEIPADAVAKIYLISDQSIVSVPFEFKDVPVTGSEGWGVKAKQPDNVAEGRVVGADIMIDRITRFSGTDDGQLVNGPAVHLSVSGPEVIQAKGIRTIVKTVTDETGHEMKRVSDPFRGGDGKFQPLKKPFGGQPRADEFTQELSFSASGETKSMKTLSGTVELLIPARDPACIVAASFATEVGKPLTDKGLEASGVTITLVKPRPTDTFPYEILGEKKTGITRSYEIRDPKNAIGAVEWFNDDGEKLDSLGNVSYGTNPLTVSVNLPAETSENVVVKFYRVTDKSVVSVPFEFKGIAVP